MSLNPLGQARDLLIHIISLLLQQTKQAQSSSSSAIQSAVAASCVEALRVCDHEPSGTCYRFQTPDNGNSNSSGSTTMWKLFRIFYNALFIILSIILFLLTIVTPGDIIFQSLRNNRLGNIFAIASVYIVALLLSLLIYLTRLYTNRSVLGGIPRPWVPVEKPDVPKSVRRLVVEGLTRSAVIAQQATPRDRTDEDNDGLDPRLVLPADAEPPWGEISQPGWTAPECPDLPDQEFETVVRELPHLLEAKAVSLAPPDLRLTHFQFAGPSQDTTGKVPDERIVDILQRPRSMCLRGYLNHLARLDMIHNPEIATSFIRLFERARYSERPLTESEFRSLTGMFAELLRGMKDVDSAIVAEVQAGSSLVGSHSMDTRPGPSLGDNSSFTTSDVASFLSSQSGSIRFSRYHPLGAAASDGASFRLRDIGDQQSLRSAASHRSLRTPSTRSLRPMPSNLTGKSEQSVIRRTATYG